MKLYYYLENLEAIDSLPNTDDYASHYYNQAYQAFLHAIKNNQLLSTKPTDVPSPTAIVTIEIDEEAIKNLGYTIQNTENGHVTFTKEHKEYGKNDLNPNWDDSAIFQIHAKLCDIEQSDRIHKKRIIIAQKFQEKNKREAIERISLIQKLKTSYEQLQKEREEDQKKLLLLREKQQEINKKLKPFVISVLKNAKYNPSGKIIFDILHEQYMEFTEDELREHLNSNIKKAVATYMVSQFSQNPEIVKTAQAILDKENVEKFLLKQFFWYNFSSKINNMIFGSRLDFDPPYSAEIQINSDGSFPKDSSLEILSIGLNNYNNALLDNWEMLEHEPEQLPAIIANQTEECTTTDDIGSKLDLEKQLADEKAAATQLSNPVQRTLPDQRDIDPLASMMRPKIHMIKFSKLEEPENPEQTQSRQGDDEWLDLVEHTTKKFILTQEEMRSASVVTTTPRTSSSSYINILKMTGFDEYSNLAPAKTKAKSATPISLEITIKQQLIAELICELPLYNEMDVGGYLLTVLEKEKYRGITLSLKEINDYSKKISKGDAEELIKTRKLTLARYITCHLSNSEKYTLRERIINYKPDQSKNTDTLAEFLWLQRGFTKPDIVNSETLSTIASIERSSSSLSYTALALGSAAYSSKRAGKK
ncbi:MAG TPA: hypothetical protein VHZ76_09815 [Gammaproteobacteria bacterium]|nr:hypothetical protein [Gammaproteobacteria bacterium]